MMFAVSHGLVDMYKKTLVTDGIARLYRKFTISCIGIIIYRGLYFRIYDSYLKLVLLVDNLEVRGGSLEDGGWWML